MKRLDRYTRNVFLAAGIDVKRLAAGIDRDDLKKIHQTLGDNEEAFVEKDTLN